MIGLILSAFLANGVTNDSILIGMENEVQSFSADEQNLGMRIVIREANDSGGVHGRKLKERSYSRDRNNWMNKQILNAKHLVERDDVFLLFNFGGPASVTLGEYVKEKGVPYMFPHTALLTVDGEREIFTSYPRYDGETAAMMRYLGDDAGVKRIGVIYANNAYGQYFASRARNFAHRFGYNLVDAQTLARDADHAVRQVKTLRKQGADAIIMAVYSAGARQILEAKHQLNWDGLLISSGPLTDEQYFREAGDAAEGTLGFCHYPSPTSSDAEGVVEYRRLLEKYFPGRAPSRYSLYGYVMGNLVVEGLRRTGPNLTRDGFINAMESIKDWDTGGITPPISFSATDHHAQTAGFICQYVDGKFRPLTDWIDPEIPDPVGPLLPEEPEPVPTELEPTGEEGIFPRIIDTDTGPGHH